MLYSCDANSQIIISLCELTNNVARLSVPEKNVGSKGYCPNLIAKSQRQLTESKQIQLLLIVLHF